MTLRASAVVLALVVGCASSPGAGDSGASELRGTTCDLTVIVWSDHLQQPVPGQGVVASLSEPFEARVDIRQSPKTGQTVSGLAPGRYRVKVTARYLPTSGTKPVRGEQVIYLEPGSRQVITIVAVDRKDDLGLADQDTLPASTPQLPPRRGRG